MKLYVGDRVTHPVLGQGRVGSVPSWGGKGRATALVRWDSDGRITTVNQEDLIPAQETDTPA